MCISQTVVCQKSQLPFQQETDVSHRSHLIKRCSIFLRESDLQRVRWFATRAQRDTSEPMRGAATKRKRMAYLSIRVRRANAINSLWAVNDYLQGNTVAVQKKKSKKSLTINLLWNSNANNIQWNYSNRMPVQNQWDMLISDINVHLCCTFKIFSKKTTETITYTTQKSCFKNGKYNCPCNFCLFGNLKQGPWQQN